MTQPNGHTSPWSTEPKVPFAPIETYCATDRRALAELLGISHRAVDRIITERGRQVPLSYAERYAERLGVHPIELWGDAYLAAVAEGERTDDD